MAKKKTEAAADEGTPNTTQDQGGQASTDSGMQPPGEEANVRDKGGRKRVIKALAITAVREGFRRAGRSWSVAPTVVALAELTAEQIKALREEPALVVSETEIEGEE